MKCQVNTLKWIASSHYPISSSLAAHAPPAARSRASNLRVNIVSPDLCDDTLQRLAPSLKEYHHCDIVDINPGACLWSSKLHDLLQPRRHLLLEPEKDIYQRYLDPLLNAVGSRYHHVPLDTREYFIFDKLFGHGLLPEQDHQERMSSSNPKLNRTLLITANLSSRECDLLSDDNYMELSAYMSYAFLKSYLLRSVFNKYGLVRLLMWLPQAQAERLLPKSTSQRTKESVLAELTAEVDITTCSQAFLERDPKTHTLYVQDHDFMMSKMAQERVAVPENRQLKLKEPSFLELDIDLRENLSALIQLENKPDWIQEWSNLEDGLARGEFTVTRGRTSRSDKSSDSSAKAKRLKNLRGRFGTQHRQHREVMDLINRRSRLDNAADLDEARLAKEAQLIEQKVQKLNDYDTIVFKRSIDDYRILKDRLAGLQWNRRQAEPLVNTEEEFYPHQSLSLVDFRPEPSVLQRIDNHEKLASILFFFDQVLKLKSTPLPTVLEELAPGGLDWLASEVPGLEAWAKDIHTDLSGIRARSIPSSLLLELALAWHRWPFRTSTEDLQREMPLSERAYFTAS